MHIGWSTLATGAVLYILARMVGVYVLRTVTAPFEARIKVLETDVRALHKDMDTLVELLEDDDEDLGISRLPS